MRKLRLLDLFCGAGGCSMGYHRGGFDVTGIDARIQPNYPFKFVLSDAIKFLVNNYQIFDIIHASPPCQRFSNATKRWGKQQIYSHANYINLIREILIWTGKRYIIENVEGSPLINPTTLCGSMFGLPIRRHRLFETNFYIQRLLCKHHLQKEVVGVYGKPGGVSNRRNQTMSSFDDWKRAMEIDWMSSREIAQAVPPAYTFYISKFITEHKTIKFINSPH